MVALLLQLPMAARLPPDLGALVVGFLGVELGVAAVLAVVLATVPCVFNLRLMLPMVTLAEPSV